MVSILQAFGNDAAITGQHNTSLALHWGAVIPDCKTDAEELSYLR